MNSLMNTDELLDAPPALDDLDDLNDEDDDFDDEEHDHEDDDECECYEAGHEAGHEAGFYDGIEALRVALGLTDEQVEAALKVVNDAADEEERS